MRKRGFVWISAVLYIALGIVAISLVMTAGLPLINKMKDRNTILQTKELMHTIDKNIQQVRSEGVGSRRFLEPVIIKGGKLFIDDSKDEEKIWWEMKTKAKIMEACEESDPNKDKCTQSEGNLKMYAFYTPVEGEYLIKLELNYKNTINLEIKKGTGYSSGSALVGKYALSIEKQAGNTIEIGVI